MAIQHLSCSESEVRSAGRIASGGGGAAAGGRRLHGQHAAGHAAAAAGAGRHPGPGQPGAPEQATTQNCCTPCQARVCCPMRQTESQAASTHSTLSKDVLVPGWAATFNKDVQGTSQGCGWGGGRGGGNELRVWVGGGARGGRLSSSQAAVSTYGGTAIGRPGCARWGRARCCARPWRWGGTARCYCRAAAMRSMTRRCAPAAALPSACPWLRAPGRCRSLLLFPVTTLAHPDPSLRHTQRRCQGWFMSVKLLVRALGPRLMLEAGHAAACPGCRMWTRLRSATAWHAWQQTRTWKTTVRQARCPRCLCQRTSLQAARGRLLQCHLERQPWVLWRGPPQVDKRGGVRARWLGGWRRRWRARRWRWCWAARGAG